jgi:tartrate-resistant acid phosphatase type 5
MCFKIRCQRSARLAAPTDIWAELLFQKHILSQKFQESTAKWKIVFGHHPLYTKGRFHGVLGDCLRLDSFIGLSGHPHNGVGLEAILIAGKVDAYISGHEHVAQYHHGAGGVHHFVAGAAGAVSLGFYGGSDPGRSIDWVDEEQRGCFLAVTATKDSLRFRFISTDNRVIKEVLIEK